MPQPAPTNAAQAAPRRAAPAARPSLVAAIAATTPPTAPASPAARPAVHRAGDGIFTRPTSHNAVTLHTSADESRQALLDAIANAKQSFFIETYEWHDDASGNQILQALAARKRAATKAGQPFDAKVIIDGTGINDRAGDEAMVQKLRAAGIEVIVFHPGVGTGALTHRKLYIQDGARFLTGGRNIGDEYLGTRYTDATGTRQNAWHDLLVTIEGDETGRAIDNFYQDWVAGGGRAPETVPPVEPSPTGTARVQTFVTDPDRQIYAIRQAHAAMIAHAKREIVLEVPYLSDDALIDELIAAKRARPKLSIKVMLPALHENSTSGEVYALLNAHSAAKLAAAGIEVRMVGGDRTSGKAVSRFSHLKALVVDRQLLSVGSANGDARTYGLNHETISVIDDAPTVDDFMAQVALPDWQNARPFDPAKRPELQSPIDALRTGVLRGLDFVL